MGGRIVHRILTLSVNTIYTSLFASSVNKPPPCPAEVLDGPLAPQGTPSARTPGGTKGNGRFRAVLAASYRHMRARASLAGARASAAASRPLPSPHCSWALPDLPPSPPRQLSPQPLRPPASGAPAVTCAKRPKSEGGHRPNQAEKTDSPKLAHQ